MIPLRSSFDYPLGYADHHVLRLHGRCVCGGVFVVVVIVHVNSQCHSQSQPTLEGWTLTVVAQLFDCSKASVASFTTPFTIARAW